MGRTVTDSVRLGLAGMEERRVRWRRHPPLAEVRGRLLPQLVPASLVAHDPVSAGDLAAIRHLGDIAVAFVIDEPDRYAYINRGLMRRWRVAEADLFALALRNLEQVSHQHPRLARIGHGQRLRLVWKACDGYDASRLLLTRQLCEAAAQVPGNPIIGVPHRDYMVMFGDRDPGFVAEMADQIHSEFSHHPYPVSPRLYTLAHGSLAPYHHDERLERVLN